MNTSSPPGGLALILESRDINNILVQIKNETIPLRVRESDIRTKLQAFPRDSQSWYLLANLLEDESRLIEAEEAIGRALSLNPQPVHFHVCLARILNRMGRRDDAMRVLTQLSNKPALSKDDGISDNLMTTIRADSLLDTHVSPSEKPLDNEG